MAKNNVNKNEIRVADYIIKKTLDVKIKNKFFWDK